MPRCALAVVFEPVRGRAWWLRAAKIHFLKATDFEKITETGGLRIGCSAFRTEDRRPIGIHRIPRAVRPATWRCSAWSVMDGAGFQGGVQASNAES